MQVDINFYLKVISSLVGGIALFNLSHQILDIGLNGVFIDLINWYGQIFFFPLEFLDSIADWIIPDWNKNLMVLIVILSMLNARSISYQIQLKFQDAEHSLADAPFFTQVVVGAKIMLAWLLGAYDVEYPFSLSTLAVATMTLIAFTAFVTITLFIPYLRYITSFSFLMTSCFIMLYALRLIEKKHKGNENKADGFIQTNINIWSNTYLSAIAALIIYFAFNRYVA